MPLSLLVVLVLWLISIHACDCVLAYAFCLSLLCVVSHMSWIWSHACYLEDT